MVPAIPITWLEFKLASGVLDELSVIPLCFVIDIRITFMATLLDGILDSTIPS